MISSFETIFFCFICFTVDDANYILQIVAGEYLLNTLNLCCLFVFNLRISVKKNLIFHKPFHNLSITF